MRRFLVCVAVVVLSMCSAALAQVPSINMPRTEDPVSFEAEQRRTVIDYCRADFDGARLSPQGFQRVRQFLTQSDNPKFDGFEVASRYSVPAPPDPSGPVVATYRLVGRWDNRSGWKEGNFVEDVRFDVVKREGAAVISNIEPGQPHVSARAALAYLRQRLAAAQTDSERSMIQKGIDALSAIVASATSTKKP
ncbi:MAG TPA: hypothetical protein VF786_12015 [Terriglobales bacterium]